MQSHNITWGGKPYDSKAEAVIDLGAIQGAGIPHAYNQPLSCGDPACCGRWNLRRPDWVFWADDGYTAVILEHSELLTDNAVYIERFLKERLPWYERHSRRFLLLLTEKVDSEPIEQAIKLTREALADGGKLLHRNLQDGTSVRVLKFYRMLLEARLAGIRRGELAQSR